MPFTRRNSHTKASYPKKRGEKCGRGLTSSAFRRVNHGPMPPPCRFYPVAGDLGVVWDRQSSSLSAFPLGVGGHTCGRHCWEEGVRTEKKKRWKGKKNNPTVADRPRDQHLWLPTWSLRLSSEICYSGNLQSGTGCRVCQSMEEAKCPGRLVPACRDVSYLFRVAVIDSHFAFALPQEGPTCFLALKVLQWGVIRPCAYVWVCAHADMRQGWDVCWRECNGMSRPVQPAEDELHSLFCCIFCFFCSRLSELGLWRKDVFTSAGLDVVQNSIWRGFRL